MGFEKFLVVAVVLGVFVCQTLSKDPETIEIHATGNSSVPSINYIVDAVELLKTAYEIYPDDQNRADAYIQLYEAKYPEYDWNVAMCYKSIKIKAPIFVELQVTGGGKNFESTKKLKSDSKTDCLVMLFSSNKTIAYQQELLD